MQVVPRILACEQENERRPGNQQHMQNIVRFEPYAVLFIQRFRDAGVEVAEIPGVDNDKGKPEDDHVPVEFVLLFGILVRVDDKQHNKVDADKADEAFVRDDEAVGNHGAGEHIE